MSSSERHDAALEEALSEQRAHRTRVAALILEVLAGERTSGEAARELGVSPTRYYLIEQRAIEGLVRACAPRPRGPRRDPEREVLKLKEEVRRLESMCRRTASLLRLSQRGLGVSPSASTSTASSRSAKGSKKASGKAGGKRRRVRRGKARALTLAHRLRSEKPKDMDSPDAHGDNPGEVTRSDG